MADRPQAPSKQEEVVAKKAAVDVVVPPTELVLPMAAHTYTREQVIELIIKVKSATKSGMSIRFA
jgi:excinuclease UvrABC helicase subunit UvrB